MNELTPLLDAAFDESLALIACSRVGCVGDVRALLSHDDGTIERLCQKHYTGALIGMESYDFGARRARAQAINRIDFDALSPIEQWQQEGR